MSVMETLEYISCPICGTDDTKLLFKRKDLRYHVSETDFSVIRCRHGTMWLTNGIYFLTVAMADPDAETDVQYDQHFDGLQFEIETTDGIFGPSVVNLNAHMEFKQLGFVVGS